MFVRSFSRYRQFITSRGYIIALIVSIVLLLFPHIYSALHRYNYYQGLAPAGWHTIVPLNENDSGKYAVSPDIPGLILTCGLNTCSRSRDAGKDWQQIKTPTAGDITAPSGGNGTFFLAEINPKHIDRLWVSHDAGSTWKQLHPQGFAGSMYVASDALAMISLSFYRDGKLYSEGGSAPLDSPQARQFAVSNDDGQTWSYPEKHPSNAE